MIRKAIMEEGWDCGGGRHDRRSPHLRVDSEKTVDQPGWFFLFVFSKAPHPVSFSQVD